MKKILLIDGNSLMFRAYYATAYTGNLMQTSTGMYSNAVYGFVNMINKVTSEQDFDHIFVAFDKGKKTFRHQAYTEYKGNRKPMPPEFAMQIPLIKEYLDVLQIKRLETDEYEADDLIATMATKAINNGYEALVISGDKDLLQLVNDKTTVALTKKGISELEFYTPQNFHELMGFNPNQVTDYKGLYGDDSDNLPGVTGVGEKTAIKLLNEYGTLENIIDNASNIKGKLGERILNDQEQAKKCKYLATLCLNAEIPVDLDDTTYIEPSVKELRAFFEKMEFKSFIKRLDTSKINEVENKVQENVMFSFPNIEIDNLNLFLEEIKNCDKNIIVEVELDGINYHKANLIGFSLLIDDYGFYFNKQFIYQDEIIDFLNRDDLRFKAIDLKRVYCTFMKYGIQIKHFDFDVILCSYVADQNLPNHDIKYIFDQFQTVELPYFEEVYGKKSILQIPTDDVIAKYSIYKCYYTKMLEPKMMAKLDETNQTALLKDIEIPLAVVLGDIELNGFKINKTRLEEIGLFLSDEISDLEKEIYELVGHEFNIASPKQLGVVLFEELNIGKGKKNKTGYSTSAEVLEKLAHLHPVPRKILEYRKYSKLLSTYVVGLSEEISKVDGKVHTTFKQALTQTGRLSSTEPNIQNIPVRTSDGRLIRSAFVPSFEDGYLVSADYSQIELRILAHVSGCKNMIDDFNHGIDFHTITASKIYGVDVENVTKDMRRIAKAVNFGIVYGMSDWGLSEQLQIPVYEASDFIKKYFEIYPEIKTYLNDVVEDCKLTTYTTTIFNRRRYIKEINSSNHNLSEFAKRTAMNAPIQGSAADIIKIAMINVHKKMKELNLQSKMVAQVHDELIIDVHPSELEIVKQMLKEIMESAASLKVKMIVDVEEGKTWDLK